VIDDKSDLGSSFRRRPVAFETAVAAISMRVRLNGAHSVTDVVLACVRAAITATRLLLCIVLVGASALACQRSRELDKAAHLNLGVHFATRNPLLEREFKRALNFWSSVLDMQWHKASDKRCDVELVDGKPEVFGPVDVALALSATGTVAFDSRADLNEIELYVVCVHELGHLFGLNHNPSPKSVMFELDVRGNEVLDSNDIATLARHHRLRHSVGRRRGRGTQIMAGIPRRASLDDARTEHQP
jgi:matrixin